VTDVDGLCDTLCGSSSDNYIIVRVLCSIFVFCHVTVILYIYIPRPYNCGTADIVYCQTLGISFDFDGTDF